MGAAELRPASGRTDATRPDVARDEIENKITRARSDRTGKFFEVV
jgi:hypothetical protein